MCSLYPKLSIVSSTLSTRPLKGNGAFIVSQFHDNKFFSCAQFDLGFGQIAAWKSENKSSTALKEFLSFE